MRRSSLVLVLGLASLLSAAGQAQTVGRVTGRVIDVTTGEGINAARVSIVGTMVGAISGVDGRFNINGVPTGPLVVQVLRIGYAEKQVMGLYMHENETVVQNISLAVAAVSLTTMVVTAAAERGTVSEALDQQRTSTNIVSSTTAEQIAKSPDGNAAQAVQRVAGINIGENNTVTARGLSDKYTISTLDGARIPSPEPEKRVVPLDLFPSGLLQSITTAKTFTPDLQGDFAGAIVNIKTKEFPARRVWSSQIGGGYASGATGSQLITAASAGGEDFAMGRGNRQMSPLLKYLGNFEGLTLTQTDQNQLISQFRNAWTPNTAAPPPNASGSLSVGGNDPVLFGHRIGYLFSGTYSSGTDLKDHAVRALAASGTTRGQAVELDRFEGQTATQSVLWGGLVNIGTMIGNSTRLTLNGMYNRTADNTASIERGSFEVIGLPVKVTRMEYVERAVRSMQLAGEHSLSRQRIDWAVTSSGVRRDEPDRSEFIQAVEHDTPGGPEILRWVTNNGAVRTFSALNETSNEGRASYQLAFGPDSREHSVKFGALARNTDRTADNREYSIYSTHASQAVRELTAEQLFDGRFTGSGDSLFSIAPLAQGGSYTAHDRLTAGYAMTELALGERVRVIAGARYEHDHVTVNAQSTLGTPVSITKDWGDVLPSLSMNLQLADRSQIRFSASRTLSRPEYRELTPVATQEVLNGELAVGNDKLERARIINADVRWESYGAAGDLLSVAAFAKRFDKPIERIYRAAAQGHTVYFANAERADNYGVEIEVRRELAPLSDKLAPFSVFSNITLMHSSITLSPDAQASATNLTRRMVGQAPYVVNGGVSYSREGGMTATLLYNRVGERIQAAGDSPLPDVVQQAHDGLDFSLRFPILGAWAGRLDAKNLLDTPFRTTQGAVVREEYRIGRVLQAGLTWKP